MHQLNLASHDAMKMCPWPKCPERFSFPFLGQCVLDRCVPPLNRILRPNSWTIYRPKSFLPCYSLSPLKLSYATRFLFLQLTQPLTSFYSSVTVHCRGKRRKTWLKIKSPSPWFEKSIQKPQAWELSRLCPETSTKLYVHEFGFCPRRILCFPGRPSKKGCFVRGLIVQVTYHQRETYSVKGKNVRENTVRSERNNIAPCTDKKRK